MSRHMSDRMPPWGMLVVGAAASATAIAYAALRTARRSRDEGRREGREIAELEENVVQRLREDAITGSCAIDVAAIAPGIIELSGVVPNDEAAKRAARLMHSVPGVRTVINRLEEGSVEERLAENRARRLRGEPETRERHWTGVGVGTGRRRQSPTTDPDRPSDRTKEVSRALEVSDSDLADALPQGADGGQGVH